MHPYFHLISPVSIKNALSSSESHDQNNLIRLRIFIVISFLIKPKHDRGPNKQLLAVFSVSHDCIIMARSGRPSLNAF